MKIVRYYPRAFAGDGGMTAAVHSSAAAMSARGAKVVVAYEAGTAKQEPPPGPVEYLAVEHRRLGAMRLPIWFEDVVRDADVLVLHSAWTSHNLAAAAAARRVGVPYVLEPRGAYDPHIVSRRRMTKWVWWHAAERRMVDEALALHVFFAAERTHLARLGYRGPVVTAPNGVDLPDGERWDGGSGDYLLWLGRFDPEHKGLDVLIDAIAWLPRRERPTVRLLGPDWRGQRKDVARMVAAKGLGDVVSIEGSVHGAEKRQLVSRARAFVYPSRWEAFGNSVAEAAALGVPVLTTRYPLGMYLRERHAGLACAPDPKALGSGIRRVMAPAAARMGAKARAIAEHELSWDAVAQTWLHQVGALL